MIEGYAHVLHIAIIIKVVYIYSLVPRPLPTRIGPEGSGDKAIVILYSGHVDITLHEPRGCMYVFEPLYLIEQHERQFIICMYSLDLYA